MQKKIEKDKQEENEVEHKKEEGVDKELKEQ